MIMSMTNYHHFHESVIIANHAMRYKDPLNTGIRVGCRYLLDLRRTGLNFNQDLFDAYLESYIIMARGLIKERQRFLKHNRVGKMKQRLMMGLPAKSVAQTPKGGRPDVKLKQARADFAL